MREKMLEAPYAGGLEPAICGLKLLKGVNLL